MTTVMLDYMCVLSFMSTHTQCFMLIVNIITSPEAGCCWLRVCYVAMTMAMLDYIHVCAKFHDHTHH